MDPLCRSAEKKVIAINTTWHSIKINFSFLIYLIHFSQRSNILWFLVFHNRTYPPTYSTPPQDLLLTWGTFLSCNFLQFKKYILSSFLSEKNSQSFPSIPGHHAFWASVLPLSYTASLPTVLIIIYYYLLILLYYAISPFKAITLLQCICLWICILHKA